MNKGKLKGEEERSILVQIPSIMTKSFEIIGKHLCSLLPEVSVIEFRGKHNVANIDELDIDKDYGITFFSTDNKELSIEYIQERDIKTTKVKNPFDLNIYNKIMKYINQYLGKFETRRKDPKKQKIYDQDLSIESLVLRVTDKKLQSKAGTETDDFMAFFKTTKYENKKFKKQLEDYHIRVNKEYLFEAGFKYTSLNLIQLIETEKYYKNKRDTRSSIIYWEGLQDPVPIANNDIAWYLRYDSGYFPEDFVRLKQFYVTKANIIKMIDGGI